jgi:hypothetical protein
MTEMSERFVPVGLLILGVVQVATGVVMLIDPGFFYDQIASFAPENEHFIRDIGTFTGAFGLALLWSVRTPSWRLPLLAFGLVQYALHTVNHLVDIDATATDSHGPVNFVAIAIGTGFLLFLLHGETRRRRAPERAATPDP